MFEEGGKAIYHSEPLAQQAVLHLTHSFTAAICHFLKPAHLGSGGWSKAFVDAVVWYLNDRVDQVKNWPGDWRCDTVIQSLKTLCGESDADFFRLRGAIYKEWQGDWEGDEILYYLDMAFDYIFFD